MFGFFSFLPFSVSDTVYNNGEIFTFILDIDRQDSEIFNIKKSLSFILELNRDLETGT